MKRIKILLVFLIVLFFVSSAAVAGDFDWIKDFNLRVKADPSWFRASLEARFKIGNVEMDAVLSNVEKPADAYIVCRLGEMSNQPIEYAIKNYKSGKGKGWGALAKSLDIKPGSKEFHALKRGHDLNDYKYSAKSNTKGKGKKKK